MLWLENVPMRSNHLSRVMPALVAGIHVFLAALQQARRRWPGQAWTSPAMTREKWFNMTGIRSNVRLYPCILFHLPKHSFSALPQFFS
jgi:hypothetical protein